ncbi:hypothetical protein BT67DRAFT_440485 [Trichocladium antarcticum]|uniref:Uncharacterized protein n=1 Tax=Trichocladium antarcticum TaxID=1450529 RepID=A0AAN6ZFI1_9PEZI|nr:hypothetical protein BT67DRAFT_440485 [Trichocladium antarcticum]
MAREALSGLDARASCFCRLEIFEFRLRDVTRCDEMRRLRPMLLGGTRRGTRSGPAVSRRPDRNGQIAHAAVGVGAVQLS